jgi:hypothetical protein
MLLSPWRRENLSFRKFFRAAEPIFIRAVIIGISAPS